MQTETRLWVDPVLEGQARFKQIEKSVGFRRVKELFAELYRYSLLLRDYRPPAWVTFKDEPQLFKRMAPQEGWRESITFLEIMEKSTRMTGVISKADVGRLTLTVSWFIGPASEACAICTFTSSIKDGKTHPLSFNEF